MKNINLPPWWLLFVLRKHFLFSPKNCSCVDIYRYIFLLIQMVPFWFKTRNDNSDRTCCVEASRTVDFALILWVIKRVAPLSQRCLSDCPSSLVSVTFPMQDPTLLATGKWVFRDNLQKYYIFLARFFFRPLERFVCGMRFLSSVPRTH